MSKRKPVNSKAKGKKFENDVAKFLSDTYDDNFIRVPHSGAFVGGSNAQRKLVMTTGQVRSFKGDIIPPDEWLAFHCEAKSHKDFAFNLLFTNNHTVLDDWIEQVRAAEDPADFNIILMKFNYKGQWVLVEQKHNFIISNSLDYREWRFCHWDNFWTPHNSNLVKQLSTQTDD